MFGEMTSTLVLDQWFAESCVSTSSGLYFLGLYNRRITFYSQQVRALRLVQALHQRQHLSTSDRIAVVGAGAAGTMSAVGLALLGYSVTLFDPAGDVLQLQSGSPRLLHPHIYEWPAMGSLESRAGLPFLDWQEGSGATVSDELRAEFLKIRTALPTLIFKSGMRLQSLVPDGTEWRLGFGTPDSERVFKHVILAMGFGDEKRVGTAVDYPYWKQTGVGTAAIEANLDTTYLVSGNGDGALTDILSLLVKGFEHLEFTRRFLGLFDSERFQAAVIKATDGVAADKDLEPLFRTELLPVLRERDVLDRLVTMLREDRKVAINSRGALFASGKASPLNQCMAFAVLEAATVAGRPVRRTAGEVDSVSGLDGDQSVTGISEAGTTVIDHFNHVILRHGPDKPARYQPVEAYFKTYREEAAERLSAAASVNGPPSLDPDTYTFFEDLQIAKLVDVPSRAQAVEQGKREEATVLLSWDEANHSLVQRGHLSLETIVDQCERLTSAVTVQLNVAPTRLDAEDLVRIAAASGGMLKLAASPQVVSQWQALFPSIATATMVSTRYPYRAVAPVKLGQALDAVLIRLLDKLISNAVTQAICPTIGSIHQSILSAVLGTWQTWRPRLDASPKLRTHFLRWLGSVSRPSGATWQGDLGSVDRLGGALMLILATHAGEPLDPAEVRSGNLVFSGSGEALGSGARELPDGTLIDAWIRPDQWDVDALILSGSAEVEVEDSQDTVITAGAIGTGLREARRVRPAIVRNDKPWRRMLTHDINDWRSAVAEEFKAWRDRQDEERQRVS
jgi:hypothetical protein